MKTPNSRRENTQEGRVTKNKVILNLIQDLQCLPLSLPLINNLRGRSHIKYGMTPLFDNNGCVEDAQQQSLSIRLFNEKYKENTSIPPLTWATTLLSPTGEEPFPMRGKVAEGRMRGIRSVLPQSGSHPTYKGYSARSYRLGVSPTGVASKNENVQRNARKLSGSHPTYKGDSARAVTPQGRYAGYSGRIGFTLIELLVVVLIIGILAAVAVPQYQKAVKKAQGREVLVAIDALDKAVADYYLEHGSYTQASTQAFAEKLSFEIPELHFFQYANPGGRRGHTFQIGSGTDDFLIIEMIPDTEPGVQFFGTWKKGLLREKTCKPLDKCKAWVNCTELQVGTDTVCSFEN